MKIALFQNEWFGVNLPQLANEIGHPLSEVAGEPFYRAIYNKLLKKDHPIPQEWINKKNNLSRWIIEFLKLYNINRLPILSIGCGLGIVEQPLIKEGFKVDLQECQEYSIQYLQKNYPNEFKKVKFILSEDLKEISEDSYDLVLSITSTYCLSDEKLEELLTSVNRVLKKQGIFIWYETALSFQDLINYFKGCIYRKSQKLVLWGWKRSLKHLLSMAEKKGLFCLNWHFFDSYNSVTSTQQIFGISCNSSTAWQVLILKKNDL